MKPLIEAFQDPNRWSALRVADILAGMGPEAADELVENFSTLPVKNFAASSSVPVIAPGVGGPGAIVLPHFVAGAGWASEIVVINNSSSILGVRLDLFKQKDGSALTTRLNQQSGTTFRNELILPGAVFTFAPRDTNGDSRF